MATRVSCLEQAVSIKQGILYIVATPIGNLADMSQRAISILSEVDLIAAEDTRHSRHLMQHFNIKTRMWAYHDHNEEQQTPVIVEKLLAGESIALISDAGTPLLSDPGYRLVKAAHAASIKVSPIPGACAAIAALSASGLPTDQFHFCGFTPSKSSSRQRFFEQFAQYTASTIYYESSHRIEASLIDMIKVFGGDRPAVLARELSKTFETIKQASLQTLSEWLTADENQRKGEFVLIVQGCNSHTSENFLLLEHALKVLLEELPVKQASKLAAKICGVKKNTVYKLALAFQSEGGSD
jgi:16S rRNA (cytidine1402-2'-O)-methyltransferase